jgi:TonB family protein
MNTRDDKTDLAQRLIVRAARRAPAALSQRLKEEWLADLDSRATLLSRLRLALDCCWATAVITRDFRVPQLAAASGAHKPLWGAHHYDLPQLSRRTLAFLAIAGVHVLIIYAFMTGLAQHVVASIPPFMRASMEQQTETQRPLPVPLLATFKLTPVIADAVVAEPSKFDFGAETPAPSVSRPVEPAGGGQSAPARPMERIIGGPDKDFPNTDDYYPAASRRMAETGAATVQVCIDAHGRLSGEPVLMQSSGSRRIDEGVLNLARAGSGHYRPTREDGAPVNSCFPFRIRFRLAN